MDTRRTLPMLALAIAFGGSGCELGVTNPNDADRERALATPGDVETLIASSYVSGYWENAQHNFSAAAAWEVMSNHGSSSWGNMGMNDTGREPREPLPNQTSFAYAYIFEEPWRDNYLGISGATDGIRALDGGVEIGPGGENNARARAFGLFVQGLGHCSIALQYDKGFLIDETTDIEAEQSSVPYADVMAFAIGKLDAAEAVAEGGSFSLPDTWFRGRPMTSAEFAALIRGYRARCRANVARTPQEAASVAWAAVRDDAASSLGDFFIDSQEDGAGPWKTDIKSVTGCGSEGATWCRMHMDFAGQGDVSGAYQAWLNTPLQMRDAEILTIPDERWPQGTVDGEVGPTTTAIFSRGYYEFHSNGSIFRPERGTYRQSHYGSNHWEDIVENDFGPAGEMLQTEMDLLQAEAALELGDIPGAVALINQTRVANGGLPAVVDAGTVPGGATCVPRKRFDPAGTCGDLRDALQWEHYNEIFALSSGLTFFFTRRQGELPAGTALHLPIPASELEVLEVDIYTFGGSGEGSAPPPTPDLAPRSGESLDRILQRVSRTLEVYKRRQEARSGSPRVH